MKALDPIISKIEGMNDNHRRYVFIVLLFLVFILDYFVLMRPQISTLTKINPEIKLLSDNVKNAENDILRVDQYRKQVVEYQAKLEKVDRKVRSRNEVPLILERISRIADDSGVKIEQIMPQSDEIEMVLDGKNKSYHTIPILIEARSGFHNYGRFINNLENAEIHLEIESFVVNSINNSRLHSIKLTLLAIIYEKKT